MSSKAVPRPSGPKSEEAKAANKKGPESAKVYIPQTDVPAYSLEQALRIPRAIAENYARRPTPALKVAAAMNMQPSSGSFRMLTGAAIAYGLTTGGAQAPEIGITPLGMRIVRPLNEGDDLAAKREALLKPRVVGEFLRRYNGSPLPKADIAKNVVIDMGVPDDRVETALQLIIDGARAVGFIQTIKDRDYVHLEGVDGDAAEEITSSGGDEETLDTSLELPSAPASFTRGASAETPASLASNDTKRRMFITHGKNKEFLEPIKKLIEFGKFEAVVAIDKQSVSKPMPDHVMNSMRSCGSAVIHVDAETTITDKDGKNHVILNPNVLIEIGAAMALYGRRFILLVKDGVQLPSNLQGLAEVRYSGEILDAAATIRLLEAINDVQNHIIPDRYKGSE